MKSREEQLFDLVFMLASAGVQDFERFPNRIVLSRGELRWIAGTFYARRLASAVLDGLIVTQPEWMFNPALVAQARLIAVSRRPLVRLVNTLNRWLVRR